MDGRTSEVVLDEDESGEAVLSILGALEAYCPSGEHEGAISAGDATEALGRAFGLMLSQAPQEHVRGYLHVFLMAVAERHPWMKEQFEREIEIYHIWKNQ